MSSGASNALCPTTAGSFWLKVKSWPQISLQQYWCCNILMVTGIFCTRANRMQPGPKTKFRQMCILKLECQQVAWLWAHIRTLLIEDVISADPSELKQASDTACCIWINVSWQLNVTAPEKCNKQCICCLLGVPINVLLSCVISHAANGTVSWCHVRYEIINRCPLRTYSTCLTRSKHAMELFETNKL